MANTPADKKIGGNSEIWKNWMSELSLTTCEECIALHGKIYSMDVKIRLPKHPNGKCVIVPMRTIVAGTVSEMGEDGVDVYLMRYGKLPDYYVSKDEAAENGWVSKEGNLATALPGKMIGGDIYANAEGKLPYSIGRVWYEADFDYTSGWRNNCRIVYSNDGLFFVTYDHLKTFYELKAQ